MLKVKKNSLFLAPMTGITDTVFRLICKEMGADMVYTEFVSANGIIRENKKTLDMMKFKETERPLGIQIFGDSASVLGESAKIIREQNSEARFLLFGYPDDHVDSIDEGEIINEWNEKYGIEYMGYSSNPIESIKECSVFVLLSYKEGTPRVVLEAMAMGRPIITTDTPGCRETVIDQLNGFLVPKKDYLHAASSMKALLDQDLRQKMGNESRKYCESKFDVHNINDSLFNEMGVK